MPTPISLVFDSSVGAATTDTQLSMIPAAGKVITITEFGGYVKDGFVALQWGSGASWQTIRAFGGTFNLQFKKDFTGDGAKRFRLVRKNDEIVPRAIAAWVEGYIQD